MKDVAEFIFWLFLVIACLVVVDFVRLVIQKMIWLRRHRRMVAELKRREDAKKLIAEIQWD